MKKFAFSLAGAATVLASATVLIDYGRRKAKGLDAHPVQLTAGIVGALAGVTLAVLGEVNLPIRKKYVLELDDLLDEEDFALMDENISEVLGGSNDHHARSASIRQIELDEEATIDDFM